MPQRSDTGARIRARRLGLGLSQADLASRAGISSSYLNLIEHDRRRIAGRRLADLARQLGCDPAGLTRPPDRELAGVLDAQGIDEDTDALALRFPGWAAHVAAQAHDIAALQARLATQGTWLAQDPALAAALHQIVTTAASIQSTAGILVDGDLDADWQSRFHGNIHDDSQRLAQASEALMRYVERLSDGPRVDPEAELAGWLVGTGHHVAALEDGTQAQAASANGTTANQVLGQSTTDETRAGAPAAYDTRAGMATQTATEAVIARCVTDAGLRHPASQALAHWLRGYAGDAQALPMPVLRDVLRTEGTDPVFDPVGIAARLGVDPALVLRRLARLPSAAGLPATGLAVCDAAGCVIDFKGAPGFDMPTSGACPLWPLFEALSSPGRPVRAVMQMPGAAPVTCFAIAMPVIAALGAAPQMRATMLVVADAPQGPARAAGATCRRCGVAGCAARRVPQDTDVPGVADPSPRSAV